MISFEVYCLSDVHTQRESQSQVRAKKYVYHSALRALCVACARKRSTQINVRSETVVTVSECSLSRHTAYSIYD